MNHKLIFFGNERLATGVRTTAATLESLVKAGYEIAAVVSNFERGQSRSARALEIAEVAEAHHIPVLLPDKPTDILDQLRSFEATAAILVAYGRIVPQSIIDIFPRGIINIHPSLLPLHRGPIPIESVILDGSTETGVSLMSLTKAMDAGPVYGQSKVSLDGTETKQALADKLLDIGGSMLIELLAGILNGAIVAQPQDEAQATYDKLITKDAGLIDWQKSAQQLAREIRAYAEWPKSRTVLGGKEVIITQAHAHPNESASDEPGSSSVGKQSGTIMVNTGAGVLCVGRLKPAGKPEMSAAAFLAGNQL